ncbi:MAG: T9SS type A sorting domain-containing protein [Crocinitomix sp.]|nr:T9SS type A sorting domain-containing protein [Crocinitomix sp.]
MFLFSFLFVQLSFGQLSGVYTAGAPTDDFELIEDALNTIESEGISGNVEIRISNGTYNKIDLSNFAPPEGLTLTFNSASGNAADVIFNAANLLECENIEFRNLTFNMPSPITGSSVVSLNKSDTIRISGCRIIDTISTGTVWEYATLEINYGWGSGTNGKIFIDSCYIYSNDGLIYPRSSTRQTILERGSYGYVYYTNDSIFGSINKTETGTHLGREFENCYLKLLQALDARKTKSIDSCEIIFYPWNIEDTVGAGNISTLVLTNSSITAGNLITQISEIVNCNFSGNIYTTNRIFSNNYVAGKTHIDGGGGTPDSPIPLIVSNVFKDDAYISCSFSTDETIVANNIFLDTVRKAAAGAGAGGAKIHFYHNNFANDALFISNAPGDIINNNFADVNISRRGNFISHNNFNWQDSTTLRYSYYDESPTYYDPQYTSATDLHVNNASIISGGINLVDPYLAEDFEEDLRDTIPTIGADETCLKLPLQDTIKMLCASNYTFKLCDFDPLVHHWGSNSIFIDSTLANPVIFVDSIINVFLMDSLNNILDSTVLIPELLDSRKRNLYGYCGFNYTIATYNQPGIDVNWSPGFLFTDSTNYLTGIRLDTTTILVATQDFGVCGTRYDSIIFNINSHPRALLYLDSVQCLDYKFIVAITCFDSIRWSISDGSTYDDVSSVWHSFPEEGFYEVIVKVWKFGELASDTIQGNFRCLSVEESNLETFQLFPNPVDEGYFKIILPESMSGKTYTLHDNLGQLVKSGVTAHAEMVISVHDLTPGIYLFNIEGHTKRVIVQ